MAKAEMGGIVKEISLALVDDVKAGDDVIIYGGFVLSRLEPEEANQIDNEILAQCHVAACFPVAAGRMVMTTDGFVISPLFFPGGDIGSLSVHGTGHDIAMTGARPLYLSVGMVIEDGFPLADLKTIVELMAFAAAEAGVRIIAGDTKVVERGKGDGIFITTTGIGFVPEGVNIRAGRAAPGDVVLINGTLGDHGAAVLASRESLDFETDILSDSAAPNELVADMVAAVPDIHVLCDATRGGFATVLNEIALQSSFGIWIEEEAIPVSGAVHGARELLGLDPLYVANEGKLVAFCAGEDTKVLLATMQGHPLGQHAAILGHCTDDSPVPFTRSLKRSVV